MEAPVLGFIGFGEAAFNISDGLSQTTKPKVFAFDVMANDKKLGPVIHERTGKTGVTLEDSLESLIEKSEFILNATSAKYALSIAKEAAQYTKDGKFYADLNSTSPMVKKEIAVIIDRSGGSFIDAAVMEVVPPHRHRVPIAVSGIGAKYFAEALNSIGMNVEYVNDSAGSSSSMKMFRSIFFKGFNALLMETLIASYKAGVLPQIMDSIKGTLSNKTPDDLANMFMTRTAVAAARRVTEMEDVVATLNEMNLESFASQATIKRLQWICDIGLKEYFDGKVPEHYSLVLEAISIIGNKGE